MRRGFTGLSWLASASGMGNTPPFRRSKRRWTRSKDHRPARLISRRFTSPPPRRSRIVRWLSAFRPWVFLAIALSIWPTVDPALVEPPAFLSTDPEEVNDSFTRCGPGRGVNCVIDGDTFKLGERKVRIIGIDAPETHPLKLRGGSAIG